MTLPAGATLEVLSDDPRSPDDFVAFARATGNALIEHGESAGVHRFVLRHGA